MTKKNQIYKCNICGNIVNVFHEGMGELVCCGVPMENKVANSGEFNKDVHIPKIKENMVYVGETLHPMEEDHYIEWIEVVNSNEKEVKFLNPKESPNFKFCLNNVLIVRCYCNKHGLFEKVINE